MFNLTRYFSMVCLLVMFIGAISLGAGYRALELKNLCSIGEENNNAITRSISKYVWPQYAQLIPRENSQQSYNINAIAPAFGDSIKQLIGGTQVALVNIYNTQGTLIFTSNNQNPKLNQSNKAAVLSATKGATSSKQINLDTFNSTSGNKHDVVLIASYLPLQRESSSPIEGVIEIYTDMTAYSRKIERTQIQVFLIGFVVLALIFGVLFLFIRRAEKIINSHDINLNRHIDMVNQTNRTLKQSTQEMEIARDSAHDASMLKSSFVANMSHELRTPLNAIIGYSELLIEECKDLSADDIKSDAEKINASSKKLLGLINDILDISKIEAGKMDFCIEIFDISTMISDIATTVKPLAEKNQNTLVVHCDKKMGSTVADATRTRQSIYNLLSNACKFTKNGTITLSVTREIINKKEWIVYAITDTGIGIAPEDSKIIFNEYTDTGTKSFSGSGLGLAISRRFCEMMGGTISVSSVLGEGSTFTIKLPSVVGEEQLDDYEDAQPDAAQIRMHETHEPNRRKHTSKVLIIDDDKSIQALMSYILRAEGYYATTAMSGKDGLELAIKEVPDAIILDIMMPGMDGWAVLKELKNTPELEYTAIIMLSALGEISMGEALGADGYITKPFNRKQVIDTLSNSIRTKKAIHQLNDTILANHS